MRRGLSQGLLGGGLAALLLCAPAAAPLAQTSQAHPVTIPPAKDLATPPDGVKPVKPGAKSAAKVTDKHSAPGHSAKVTTKPKPPAKKVATAKKPAPKPVSIMPAPVRQATAAPPPSYTITTVRDNVTTKTTRVVPVPAPGAAAASLASVTPKPAAPPAQAAATPPPVTAPAPTAPTLAATTPGASPSPHQTAATPASSFVSTFLGRAFGIARDGSMTPLQRRALLADLFANRMDVGRIAGYTTGDELTGQTADFQHRFKTILISYLVETYYPRIEIAADPSVKVEVTAAAPQPDGTAVVWTNFTKSDWVTQTVKWHLAPVADGFKIVDIYSGGASLVQMERDTFRSVMRDGGLPQLMAKLDARTKALSTAAP